jgi:hypothetical protein
LVRVRSGVQSSPAAPFFKHLEPSSVPCTEWVRKNRRDNVGPNPSVQIWIAHRFRPGSGECYTPYPVCSWRLCGLGYLRTARLRHAEGITRIVGSDVVDSPSQGEQIETGFKILPFCSQSRGRDALTIQLGIRASQFGRKTDEKGAAFERVLDAEFMIVSR